MENHFKRIIKMTFNLNIKVRKVATDLFLLCCDVHQSEQIIEKKCSDLVLSIGY